MKRVFREKMSYNAVDVLSHNQVHIDCAGISLNIPQDFTDYRKEFSTAANWLQLGMFGNDPKYYDSKSLTDIVPKAEDFVEIPFRLLSATIVGAGTYKATDFSNAKVLKGSMNMLEGKTVYKDHETDTDNWVGLVSGIKWSGATTVDGIQVPAGIDGIIAIDKVTNPKVARGALMGTVYSNSVTVEFDWEMSHKFEEEWDFLSKLGQMGSDGKMIRRVVTAIYNYHETSLVWLGADPFSKAYDTTGKLKHIDIGSVVSYKKAAGYEIDAAKTEEELLKEYQSNKKFNISIGFDNEVLILSKKLLTSHKQNDDMDKFLIAFIAAFGGLLNLKKEDLTDVKTVDDLLVHLDKHKNFSAEQLARNKTLDDIAAMALTTAQAEDATVTEVKLGEFLKAHEFVATAELTKVKAEAAEVVTLKADATKNADKVKLAEQYTSAKRDEAIRMYKIAAGTKADDAVIDLFKKADDKAIDGLLKQYTKESALKLSGKCSDCGSTNFEFRSSFETELPKDELKDVEKDIVTTKDIMRDFSKGSMSIGRAAKEEK